MRYSKLIIIFIIIISATSIFGQSEVSELKVSSKIKKEVIKSLKTIEEVWPLSADSVAVNNEYFSSLVDESNMELNIRANDALIHIYKAIGYLPDNAELNYRLGKASLITNENTDALTYLSKAKELGVNIHDYHDLYIGIALHKNQYFDSAITFYDKLIPGPKEEFAQRLKQESQIAKILTNAPTTISVTSLSENINSKYDEYTSVLTGDEKTLYFTSRRYSTTGNKVDPSINDYYEDIYVSTKNEDGEWSTPNNNLSLNTKRHDATVAISYDGQKMILFRDDYGNGNLYFSTFNGKKWAEPKIMNNHINTQYHESSASFSKDGKTLYFVSNKPGGIGQRDIYFSNWDETTKDWGPAKNIGPNINTQFNEEAVYINPDNSTLYFSSQGHTTMGGFDIFKSKKKDNGYWGYPSNLGYPINTTNDDVFIIISEDKKRGYLSSSNEDGSGGKDLYLVEFIKASNKTDSASLWSAIEDQQMAINESIYEFFLSKEGSNAPISSKHVYLVNKSKATITELFATERSSYITNMANSDEYAIQVFTNDSTFFEQDIETPDHTRNKIDRLQLKESSRIVLGPADFSKSENFQDLRFKIGSDNEKSYTVADEVVLYSKKDGSSFPLQIDSEGYYKKNINVSSLYILKVKKKGYTPTIIPVSAHNINSLTDIKLLSNNHYQLLKDEQKLQIEQQNNINLYVSEKGKTAKIKGVTATLFNKNTQEEKVISSDSLGYFRFQLDDRDNYDLKLEKEGYKTFRFPLSHGSQIKRINLIRLEDAAKASNIFVDDTSDVKTRVIDFTLNDENNNVTTADNVYLFEEGNGEINEILPDSNGRYYAFIDSVKEYTLEINKEGYETQKIKINMHTRDIKTIALKKNPELVLEAPSLYLEEITYPTQNSNDILTFDLKSTSTGSNYIAKHIYLTNKTDGSKREVFSNNEGKFTIALSDGDYQIQIIKNDNSLISIGIDKDNPVRHIFIDDNNYSDIDDNQQLNNRLNFSLVDDSNKTLIADQTLLIEHETKSVYSLHPNNNHEYNYLIDTSNNYHLEIEKQGYQSRKININKNNLSLGKLILQHQDNLSLKKDIQDKVIKNAITAKFILGTDDSISPVSVDEISIIDPITNKETRVNKMEMGNYEAKLEKGKKYQIRIKKEGFDPIKQEIEASDILSNIFIQKITLYPVETTVMEKEVAAAKKTDTPFVVSGTLNDISFAFNEYTLTHKAARELNQVVRIMDKNPSLTVKLHAHADTRGSIRNNYKISYLRAKACKEYLVSQEIPPQKIEVLWYGESQPIIRDAEIDRLKTDDEKEIAHKKNRRVNVEIINP